ncbi:hypothetical protein EJB05_47614 [Eragrostis curvula]|uniref:Uncharacterized protein n=1 Tax=Eragrostis curvula TaxID=38414 RepID=A0A5J9SZS6_9POAL|nr:hypothetical protein EJB05_47614 [Eragrostis curvula]
MKVASRHLHGVLLQGNAAKWGDPFPISRPDWDIITASKSREFLDLKCKQSQYNIVDEVTAVNLMQDYL